jgi:hypothetical protein
MYGSEVPPMSRAGNSVHWMTVTFSDCALKSYSNYNRNKVSHINCFIIFYFNTKLCTLCLLWSCQNFKVFTKNTVHTVPRNENTLEEHFNIQEGNCIILYKCIWFSSSKFTRGRFLCLILGENNWSRIAVRNIFTTYTVFLQCLRYCTVYSRNFSAQWFIRDHGFATFNKTTTKALNFLCYLVLKFSKIFSCRIVFDLQVVLNNKM